MPAAESALAVAVVGREPVATGNAALSLARAEARRREVIVVDLIGDAAPLRAVVLTDDDHGVADCFTYGVSFAAVSRATSVDPHVAVIPSGSEPVSYADTLPSPRWQQLIDHARGDGALVVFAALLDTPELDALIARVDHVIPASLVVAPVTAIPLEGPIRPASDGRSSTSRRRRERIGPFAGRRQAAATGIAAVVIVAVLAWWAVARSSSSEQLVGVSTATDTITSTAQLGPRAGESSVSGLVPPVADPADSANVSAYAMRVGSYPTFAEALRQLRRQTGRPSAATITPLAGPGTPTPAADGRIPVLQYAVFAGAARSSSALASDALHPVHGGDTAATTVRTPYALRLADGIKLDSAQRAATAWRARGVPAYVLVDNTGSARVYAGAFESIEQAAPLAASLHAIGLAPVLAYRVGLAR